jgi:putative transposase
LHADILNEMTVNVSSSQSTTSAPCPELVSKIDHFVAQHNKSSKPFIWTATADSILAKLERLTSRISGTGH